MNSLINFYLFVASIWFFQEWKDTKDITYSFIIGLFWIYEVFEKIYSKINK